MSNFLERLAGMARGTVPTLSPLLQPVTVPWTHAEFETPALERTADRPPDRREQVTEEHRTIVGTTVATPGHEAVHVAPVPALPQPPPSQPEARPPTFVVEPPRHDRPPDAPPPQIGSEGAPRPVAAAVSTRAPQFFSFEPPAPAIPQRRDRPEAYEPTPTALHAPDTPTPRRAPTPEATPFKVSEPIVGPVRVEQPIPRAPMEMPVFRPAERLITVANPEPVRIVIDRIEVRPAAAPAAPDKPPQRTRPAPAVSLDEYLRRGSGGRS